MADLQKTIEIIFGASDETGGAFSSVASELDNLDTAVQGIAAPFANVADGVLSATTGLAGFATAAIAASTAVAGDFDQGVRQLGALFNATEEEVAELSGTLLTFAETSTASFSEIQEGSRIALSTGTSFTDLAGVLAEAEQLADAGGASLSDSVAVLSRSLNAYGMDASAAAGFTEDLFTAAQQGDTSLTELGANLGKVAATAKASGVGFDELNAAIVGVTIAGVNTAESTTLLKSLFTELASPSAALKTALAGVTLEGDGLQAVMQQLQKATGGSQAKMSELFGSSQAVQGALILATDASGAFDTALKSMASNTGNVSQNAALMADTVGQSTQKLVNNLQATLIKVGTPFIDDFGRSVGGLNAILQGIGEGVGSPNFQNIYGSFDDLSSRLQNFLQDVGKVLPEALSLLNFDGLITAVGDLGAEFGAVFGALFGEDLDLTKAEDLAEALQSAVGLMKTLVNVTTGIVSEFQPFFEIIGKAIQSTDEASAEAEKSFGKFLGATKLLADFGTALGGTLIILKEAEADIGFVVTNLGAGASIIINTMQLAFDAFALAVVSTAEVLASALAGITVGDLSKEFAASEKELELLGKGIASNMIENTTDMEDAWSKLGTNAFASVKKIDEGTTDLVQTTNKLPGEVEKAADSYKDMSESSGETLTDTELMTKQLEDMGLIKSPEVLKEMEDDAKKAEVQVKKAEETLSKLDGEVITAQLTLETQQLDSASENIKATFASLDNTITSTGELLGTLFGELGGGSFTENQQITKAIDNETRIRNEAAEQQQALAQSQVDFFEAKTSALKAGLSEITISADGLEPELEAFMWAILDRIKLRATQDQAQFLVGL